MDGIKKITLTGTTPASQEPDFSFTKFSRTMHQIIQNAETSLGKNQPLVIQMKNCVAKVEEAQGNLLKEMLQRMIK